MLVKLRGFFLAIGIALATDPDIILRSDNDEHYAGWVVRIAKVKRWFRAALCRR